MLPFTRYVIYSSKHFMFALIMQFFPRIGNTPLHLAVMLGRKGKLKIILWYNDTKTKFEEVLIAC